MADIPAIPVKKKLNTTVGGPAVVQKNLGKLADLSMEYDATNHALESQRETFRRTYASIIMADDSVADTFQMEETKSQLIQKFNQLKEKLATANSPIKTLVSVRASIQMMFAALTLEMKRNYQSRKKELAPVIQSLRSSVENVFNSK